MVYPDLNKYRDEPLLKGEEWVPAKGLEDLYEVSNLGRVKRLEIEVESSNQNGRFTFKLEEKILAVHPDSKGYPSIMLGGRKDGRKKNHRVHRLVAQNFLEDVKGCTIVHHKDNNKMNPYYLNLEWTTLSGNQTYSYEDGAKISARGVECAVSKHKRDTVAAAYLLAKSKVMPQEKIGELLGIPQITVSNIKTKKTWQDLTDAIDEYCYEN